MTEYQTHTALAQSLEAEVSRLRAVNAELVRATQRAISFLGPEAPLCSGCEYEWNQAIKVLKEATGETK